MTPRMAKSMLSKTLQKNWSYPEGTNPNKYITVNLQSVPGIGKTSIVEQVAKENNAGFIPVVIAQYDPAEIAGFPVLSEDRTYYKRAISPFLKQMHEKVKEFGKCVVLLDEINQAVMASKNLCAQPVNEHMLGEHKIPYGVQFVTAGNPMSTRSGTSPMPCHFKDRLATWNVEADAPSFLDDYALKREFHHSITSFIRHRPEFLSKFNPDVDACPSPRSWERANTILGIDFDPRERQLALKAQLGDGATADFLGYLKVADLMPDPEEVLKNPGSAEIPEDPPVLHAICGAISAHVKKNTMKHLITYIDRIKDKEFGAFTMRDAIKRNDELRKLPEVTNWFLTSGREMML